MRKKLFLIFTIAFIARVLLAFTVWHGDVNNHMDWGEKFFVYGPSKFYAPETNVWSYLWPNQPPGSIYMFALIYKLYKIIFSFFWWINVNIPLFPSKIITFFETNLYPALLKLPGILTDLGIAYLIFRVISDFKIKKNKLETEKIALWVAVIFLLNPFSWYISSVWGQYDSIIFFLAFLGVYFLLNSKPVIGLTLYSLSLYTKVTLAIFAPLVFLIWIKNKYSFRNYLFSLVAPLLIIGFLTLPFSNSEPFSWLFRLYKDKVFVEQRQVVTSNAFNIWAFLTGIHQISHDNLFGPFSFKSWGIVLFILSLLTPLYLVFKNKSIKAVIFSFAIVSFSSFSLLTNMHERYLFPFFPLLTILLAFDKKLLPFYFCLSLIGFLNLYNFWWVPEIGFIKAFLSYNGGFFARVLGLFEFGLYLLFYRYFLKKSF